MDVCNCAGGHALLCPLHSEEAERIIMAHSVALQARLAELKDSTPCLCCDPPEWF